MPNKAKKTWILVADGAKARILERLAPNATLHPASDRCFSESEAREATRDIGTDRPGRVHESADTARHAMEPRVDWHRFAKEQFAKSVAAALEDAAKRKQYEALILIAPPQALGDLRNALGRHASALIESEVGKDLTNIPDHEIASHLR